jgi:hypothetical protein
MKKVKNASNDNTQRKIIDFLSKIDKSFFNNIDIKNLNEDENRTLLAAIRAYRNNTYYAKPTEEKIEDAYEELGLHSIK